MIRFLVIALVLTTITLSSCRPKTYQHDVDLQFVVEQGHEYAHRFLTIDAKRQTMTRYEFLLDLKTRQQQLAEDVGVDYADAFIKAFIDSAKID